ncbi:MAG: glycerol-3-phosphate 1-O-acyltransferase PlsB [Betaproteobacteria bacterium]|nr:glycerol-3-phosphate 1-O-acyltransferase PlsB [Betaproteobacteria bacterium]
MAVERISEPTPTGGAPRQDPRPRNAYRPGNLLLALLRRLLYLVVRTRVAPEDVGTLGIDLHRPVCYVLQDRHLSSLLVLEEEVRRLGLPSALAGIGAGFPGRDRALFSVILNHNPLSARTSHPSATLARLTGALFRDPAQDVQLVPVTILWGRSPKSQDSLLKALFADAWASVGPLRQLAIIALHGRQTRVNFSAPIPLSRLIDDESDPATAVRKANRFLRFHFRRMRESAIGPDLSHRRNLIEAMVASAGMQEAIAQEAVRLGVAPAAAEERARRFAWEIASDFSYPAIRVGELLLERLWRRLYDGVVVHHGEELAKVAPGKGLVYLPNHRSHVDYLLLSYLVYAQGLAPPHIAAGANLNLPLVGPLLRRGGAFFLRRSFKGEPLYAAVFREYLHAMLARGFPIAYFIEGGRSRSGRTLAPRGGMLGMTIESYMREHPRPLLLVPVHVSYEKLIEGRTLVAELEGQPKRGESLGALAGAVRNLKRVYGTVAVNFGTPLSVDAFLDRQAPGWHALAGDAQRETARGLTDALALEAAQAINAAVVINPINLFAMAIVPSPRHALDERALAQQVGWLRTIASRLPYAKDSVLADGDPGAVIAHALELGYARRIAHPLGDVIAVADGQVSALNYLRNNVLHAYALPALVASLLVASREASLARVGEFVDGGLPFLRAELMLRHSSAEAVAEARRIVELFVELGLARSGADGAVRAADRYRPEYAGLELLARSLRHLLRRNYLTIALMTRVGGAGLARGRLEELMQMLTQRLSLLSEFAPPDFYARSSFGSYIDTLQGAGLIRADADGALHLDPQAVRWERYVERLLPADAVLAIRRAAVDHAG